MLQIQLYIENDSGVLQEVELYSDESINLTQSIQDVRDIEKVLTDFSRTFSVPASKNNNKVFKHFYNYHIDGFDARKKKVAELHLNYKPFKKGRIKLEGTDLKNNEPHTYKLTFYGDTISLKDTFGEDKLSGLTELSQLDFDYTDSNIETYATDGYDGLIGSKEISDAIIFPLITHTDRLIYDSGDDTAGSFNVYSTMLTTTARGVYFNQLKPAIRLYAIIRAIELHYNISFSDDFLDSSNTVFNNLYMWMHKKEGALFSDQDAEYTLSGFSSISGDTQDITGVRNAYFSNVYDSDKFNRTLIVQITTTSTQDYSILIKKNGEDFKEFTGLNGTTRNGVALNEEVVEIDIPNGDYTFFIKTSDSGTFTSEIIVKQKPSASITLRREKEISFTGSATIGVGESISVPSNMPEMKVLDFIVGLFKMFNLTAYLLDDGTIKVQPLNDYYASSTSTWDVTKYIDANASTTNSLVPFKRVNIGYEATDTFLAKNHYQLGNKDWGKLEYDETDKVEGDTYEIKVPFEHMKMEKLVDISATNEPTIQWGWHTDSKQDSSVSKPLIFYPIQTVSLVQAVKLDGSYARLSAMYMPSNSITSLNIFGFESNPQSLNFHAEIDEYTGEPNEKTLFKTFYEDYVVDLFSKNKRITKFSAYLPLNIIENLSLADKIIVFDNIYRINKITTNFETNKSELELVNIIGEDAIPTVLNNFTFDISEDILYTADITYLTADISDTSADGLDLPPESVENPENIQSNEAPATNFQPCVVTAPTITTGLHTGDSTSITFKYSITTSGTICNVNNIDEFGFFIANNESDLSSSDIDTLKANSSVTTISTIRQTGEPILPIGEKTTKITGLTHTATRYGRFYAKTNNSDLFNEANVVSSVFSQSTIANAGTNTSTGTVPSFYQYAGYGSAGYSTIPTQTEIEANVYTLYYNALCGQETTSRSGRHSGSTIYPSVGDYYTFKTTNGIPNYTGGANSFPSTFSGTNYFAIALLDNVQNRLENGNLYRPVVGYLVIEYATAEIQAVYLCDTTFSGTYDAGTFLYSNPSPYFFVGKAEQVGNLVCGNSYNTLSPTVYDTVHNGTGANPVVGDKIRIDVFGQPFNFNGGANSFPASWLAGTGIYITLILTQADPNDSYRGIAKYIIQVNTNTAEVIEVYECP
jgi:hypothetical protein